MALSTPASGIKLGGGRRPPSDTSPKERLRGQSPRSNESGEAARSSNLWRDGLRRLHAARHREAVLAEAAQVVEPLARRPAPPPQEPARGGGRLGAPPRLPT